MTQREEKKTLENRRNQLASEIDRLKDELKQREAQLPAHSIRPHQILAIEELEEKIKRKQEHLRSVEKKLSEPPHSLRGSRIPRGSPD
jgi:chromosome segregation ATPase